MLETRKIIYNPNGGPVTLEIKAKYATLGSYSCAYVLNAETVKVGNGRLGDSIPDIYHISVFVKTDIVKCRLYIVGTYVPSPGHSQIDVEYHFYQDGKEMDGENPTIIQKTQASAVTSHSFKFIKKT